MGRILIHLHKFRVHRPRWWGTASWPMEASIDGTGVAGDRVLGTVPQHTATSLLLSNTVRTLDGSLPVVVRRPIHGRNIRREDAAARMHHGVTLLLDARLEPTDRVHTSRASVPPTTSPVRGRRFWGQAIVMRCGRRRCGRRYCGSRGGWGRGGGGG